MDYEWLPTRWYKRRRALKVAKAREPRKNRSAVFSTVTLGAAAIAFLLALFGIGPFAVQAVVIAFTPGDGPLAAGIVFPSVSPVQKIVDVYDSPKPVAPNPKPVPKPSPARNPSPSPRPSSTDSPEPGDH